MHAEVKKYAENRDIKGLRYIFVDSLDVDPTFEKYREDYEYCRKVPGLFEPHRELTPLKSNQSQWNLSYWEKLKMDLMENFSEKRFAHMIQAAKVVYADKVARVTAERRAQEQKQSESRMVVRKEPKPQAPSQEGAWSAARQEQELEKKQRELELENQRIEAEQRKQKERIAARKAEYSNSGSQGNDGTKKVMGIGLAAAAAVIIIIILLQIL